MTDKLLIGDVRKAGYCLKGVRERCALLDLDFRQLVKEGLPFSELEPIEDDAVQRSLAVARQRIEKEAQDGRR
jgi:hypothetical protein